MTLRRQLQLCASLASLGGMLGALGLSTLGNAPSNAMLLGAGAFPWLALAAADSERASHCCGHARAPQTSARLQPALAPMGPANAVTLLRAAVAAPVAGLALALALSPHAPAPSPVVSLTLEATQSWAVLGLSAVALALDGVDGAVARASGSASPYGARLDMELDAAFTAALSLLVWASGAAGLWILLAGALRYLFVAAAKIWPFLSAPLFESQRRRAVCVIQIAGLMLALSPPLAAWSAPIAACSLAALVASFGADTLWLYRSAR